MILPRVFAPLALLCCLALTVSLVSYSPASAADRNELTETLKKQKQRAKKAESTLTRLSAKERELHKELADAADRIQVLERDLAKQEDTLAEIERKRVASEKEHETLLTAQRKTETELEALLNTMWPLYIESHAGRGANTPDWHDADRRLEWSGRIYAAIDAKNRELAQQQNAIAEVLKKQEQLEQEARQRLAKVNKSKDGLLRDKLQYNRKLSSVRKQKEDAEATLKGVLSIIQNLNYRLEDMGTVEGQFAAGKGTLPWPAKGMLALRFAPNADPPTRGIGMALMEGTTVHAVASGKVVHNDVLRGFGRVVIIMHDAAYYSLYAYLTDSSLAVGQDVKRGQSLGAAGYYPRVEGTGLYFELRFHQKAINPEPWLTALN